MTNRWAVSQAQKTVVHRGTDARHLRRIHRQAGGREKGATCELLGVWVAVLAIALLRREAAMQDCGRRNDRRREMGTFPRRP